MQACVQDIGLLEQMPHTEQQTEKKKKTTLVSYQREASERAESMWHVLVNMPFTLGDKDHGKTAAVIILW